MTIISWVLCKIQQSRMAKSRIEHMDKLVPVRSKYNAEWVTSLSAKKELGMDDDHLQEISALFNEAKQPALPYLELAMRSGHLGMWRGPQR